MYWTLYWLADCISNNNMQAFQHHTFKLHALWIGFYVIDIIYDVGLQYHRILHFDKYRPFCLWIFKKGLLETVANCHHLSLHMTTLLTTYLLFMDCMSYIFQDAIKSAINDGDKPAQASCLRCYGDIFRSKNDVEVCLCFYSFCSRYSLVEFLLG